MNEKLKKKIKECPELPGIYQMLDKKGNIIYIGKSKCLKKRVQSYFVESPVWDKAKEMSRFIVDLEIVVTDTHLEAMILECEMIKKIKPYFNAMMKNDDKYSYLTLEENYHRNPLKITMMRENQSFGPFRSRGQIQDVIDGLRNLYPITKNRNKYEFEYHIFPCAMEEDIFEANRKLLKKIFSNVNEITRFLRSVERKMKKAADEQNFERASRYRDLHVGMSYWQRYLSRLEEWRGKDIVYTVTLDKGYKLFYISDGRIVFCEKTEKDTEEFRTCFAERARRAEKGQQPEVAEKEMLDYRDIVYAELSRNMENVYFIK